MTSQYANLLGAITGQSSAWGGQSSIVRSGSLADDMSGFVANENAFISSVVDTNATRPSNATPADVTIAEQTIFGEQQALVQGTARARAPVETPKSVGGDATRPGDGTYTIGSTRQIKGGYQASNGLWYKDKNAYLYSKDNPNYSGEWADNPNASTAFQVNNWLDAAKSGMTAVSSVFNGYISSSEYKMKAAGAEYLARQNQRNAELMRRNIRDINRAAQQDINVISMEGTRRKSEQRVEQAASGFKVGAGTYQVLNDNTNFMTNYNASLIMLRAGEQGAEILRQAGGLEAQSIINKAEADIARDSAKAAEINGWVQGAASAVNAGVSFYIGRYGVE